MVRSGDSITRISGRWEARECELEGRQKRWPVSGLVVMSAMLNMAATVARVTILLARSVLSLVWGRER